MSTLADLLPRVKLAEDKCIAKLAASRQRHRAVSEQIEQLVSYHQEFSIPETSVSIVRDAILFSQRLGTSIDEMRQRLIPLSDEVADLTQQWNTARSRRIALEKLIDREKRESAKTRRKRQRHYSDSLVSLAAALSENLPEE